MNLHDDGLRTVPKVPGIGGKAMTRNSSIGHSPNRTSKGAKLPALRKTSSKCYGAKPFAGRPDERVGAPPKGGAKVTMYVIKGRKTRLTIA